MSEGRVMVGVSGGVDSSVAALLLVRAGLPVYDFHAAPHTLQDAYMRVTEAAGEGGRA